MDNFGKRYFDWELGRFLTRDPSGYPDGPNNYIYCFNNPINWIDPLGLQNALLEVSKVNEENFKLGDSIKQGQEKVDQKYKKRNIQSLPEVAKYGRESLKTAAEVLMKKANPKEVVQSSVPAVAGQLKDNGIMDNGAIRSIINGKKGHDKAQGKLSENTLLQSALDRMGVGKGLKKFFSDMNGAINYLSPMLPDVARCCPDLSRWRL